MHHGYSHWRPIVSLFHEPASTVLLAPRRSNKMVRITRSLVVKFRHFVTIHEFKNQQAAQQRFNASIFNVTETFQFTKKDRIRYIVMDYVDGNTLHLVSAKSIAKELSEVLGHIHLQEATTPWTLRGGPLSSNLWPEHEEVEFSEPTNLQRWFDQHSPRSDPTSISIVMLFLRATWISIQGTSLQIVIAFYSLTRPPLDISLNSSNMYCTSSFYEIFASSKLSNHSSLISPIQKKRVQRSW